MIRIWNKLVVWTLIGVFTPWAVLADDRKDDLRKSSDEAKKGNQQQLQPSMMEHMGKAKEHLEKANEARQQKDHGTAEREEKLAMMEQMKAQQLQQQIQANNDSAQKNDQGAQKLQQDDGAKGKTISGRDAAVVDLRISQSPSKFQGQMPEMPVAPVKEETPPISPQELVNLNEFPIPGKLTSNSEVQASVQGKAGTLSQEGVNLGFDESSKGGGKTPTPTQTSTPGSAAGVVMSSGGGAAAAGGGTGSASGDFWGGIAKWVEEGNQAMTEKETRLSLKKLRGGKGKRGEKMPGSELDDEAFWKKIGKAPAQCASASGGARSQCLHVARQQMEFRWVESQKRPSTSKVVELRKASL